MTTLQERSPVLEPTPRRVSRQRAPLTPSADLARRVALALGLLCLWGVLYPVVVGSLQEQDDQRGLYAQFREQLAQATAPVGPSQVGVPVAVVDIGSVGLRGAVVVEGTSSRQLSHGPGHRRDTVLPGQAGVSVLFGRSVTFGAPFGRLGELSRGDRITVTTGQGVATYSVERLRRAGDPLPSPLAAGTGRLVLVTADGSGWRRGLAPSGVLYVDAALTSKPQPAPGGRPAVAADEQAMGVTTMPLLPLVFWLQALLAVLAGGVWLRSRWGRWQAWAVSTPVVLAALIGASGSAAQLLPNLV